jgi:hypothetical protein
MNLIPNATKKLCICLQDDFFALENISFLYNFPSIFRKHGDLRKKVFLQRFKNFISYSFIAKHSRGFIHNESIS